MAARTLGRTGPVSREAGRFGIDLLMLSFAATVAMVTGAVDPDVALSSLRSR